MIVILPAETVAQHLKRTRHLRYNLNTDRDRRFAEHIYGRAVTSNDPVISVVNCAVCDALLWNRK